MQRNLQVFWGTRIYTVCGRKNILLQKVKTSMPFKHYEIFSDYLSKDMLFGHIKFLCSILLRKLTQEVQLFDF